MEITLSAEIQSRIANLVTRLQFLNQRLQSITGSSRSAGHTVGREVIGEAAGLIAEEFFDSRRAGDLGYNLGKKWAAQQEAEQIRSQKANVEYEFRQIIDQARDILSQVSIDDGSLGISGNSSRLVGKMNRISRYAKIETKVLRAIQFLQSIQQEKLFLNNSLPEVIATRRPGYQEAYPLMREVENSVRAIIEERLAKVSSNWWHIRIPEDVRLRAEERQKKAGSGLSLIYYVDFPDYLKIIRRKDNWRDAFAAVFRDPEWVSVKLRELEPIRNALAHSRPLPPGSLDRLRVNGKDIFSRIKGQDMRVTAENP